MEFKFYVYSSTINGTAFTISDFPVDEIGKSSGKIVFITHGFLAKHSNHWRNWMGEVKRAISKKRDAPRNADSEIQSKSPTTFVFFKWMARSRYGIINYNRASANTQLAARVLTKKLKALKKQNPAVDLHLVGHSLGAHVMGQAAHWLRLISKNMYQVRVRSHRNLQRIRSNSRSIALTGLIQPDRSSFQIRNE